MLKVTRQKDNNIYKYYLQDGDDTLKIILTRVGDLYFALKSSGKREIDFNITKENMVIYQLFDELYNDIKNANIYKLSAIELANYSVREIRRYESKKQEKNRLLKASKAYLKLVNDNIITWISDDSLSVNYNTADALRITKENDQFNLLFTYYDYEPSLVRAISVKNTGSRYSPFNSAIFDFFLKLQQYDPDYHQISMEEYLYSQQKVMTKK